MPKKWVISLTYKYHSGIDNQVDWDQTQFFFTFCDGRGIWQDFNLQYSSGFNRIRALGRALGEGGTVQYCAYF